MHSPFSLSPLIRPDALGPDPITASLLYTDRILLGTDKGALLVFDLSNPAASTSTATTSTQDAALPQPSATFVSRHDHFMPKQIDQLAVIKELNALVCLSAGDLTLHSLPDLSLLSSFAPQTRGGGSTFALHTEIRHEPAAAASAAGPSVPPTIRTTLALACKRRLILLSWVDGTTWNPLVELALPHQIRGMAFVDAATSSHDSNSQGSSGGETKLIAGFSTGEYGIVTLPTPDVKGAIKAPSLGDLFSLPIPLAEPKAAAPARTGLTTGLSGLRNISGALGGALGRKLDKNGVAKVPRVPRRTVRRKPEESTEKDDEVLQRWMWEKEWGWNDEQQGEGEVLVMRDNSVIPLSADGRQRQAVNSLQPNPTITLPGAVDEALVSPPYVLSLVAPPPPATTANGSSTPYLDRSPHYTLDVHTLSDLSPIQSIPVPPEAPSPPASIAASSLAALQGSAASRPPAHTARLLTLSSTTPKPPLLILTSKSASSSNAPASLVGGAEQTLWAVTMESWPDQIEALGREEGKWEEAIELLRASYDSLTSPLPPPLSRRLATLHSLHLFRTHRYDLAIDAWIALDLTPAKIIALYPEAVSGKLFLESEAHEGLFGGRTRKQVKESAASSQANGGDDDDSSSIEGRPMRESVGAAGTSPSKSSPSTSGFQAPLSASPARSRRGAHPATALAKSASADDDDAASIRTVASRFSTSLSGKRSWLKERDPTAALEEIAEHAAQEEERQAKRDAENRARSVDELIRYLTDRRQKYSQALAALPSATRPIPSAPRSTASPDDLFSLPDKPLTKLEPEELVRVAQVVDTALFRTYLATKPVMIGPLCRIENWCEVEEVEELLLAAKKYRELLDLYNGKNMHQKAVELLKRMSAEADDDDAEEKIGPMVRYLQKLGPDHLDVIFDASRWVFAQDEYEGLQIFIADLDEVESLPRRNVMSHLETVSRDICMRYLEHIIDTLGEQGVEFHEKLVDLYLETLTSQKATRDEAAYQKLLSFLETSQSYRADRVLGRLPSEDMHEARAILLGRLGRHEGALQIYVYKLEDHSTAEQYCKRVYDSDTSGHSDIFHTLLRIYLRPRADHPVHFGPALSLLSTHAARIDAVEAFELLPPLVALQDMETYLTKTLRQSVERQREGKMVRAVGKSAVDLAAFEVVELEERRVKIGESRLCPVCHKRLGTSVIAIHNPRGEVTHYQCRELFSPGA